MGTLNRLEINSSGHFIMTQEKDQIVVNEAAGFVVGSVITVELAGTGKLYDANSEGDCAAICGLADGTYADTVTASYVANGGEISGLAGLTPGGEYYADPTTGQPGLWSAIGSGEWTRLLGTATSATTLQLQLGPVQQKA